MRYYEIVRKQYNVSYAVELYKIGKYLSEEFEDAEPGEEITIRLVEMTKEEYEKLPEFDGW